VITRSVEYFCVLYINGVALYMWINGLKPFCVENLWFVVVNLRHTENFCIFFSEKYNPVYVGEMDIRDLGSRVCGLADRTVLKTSFVFIRSCLI
jgi:hypothetical protein